MKHPLTAAFALSLAFGAGFAVASVEAVAQDAPPSAVCTQVYQQVDGAHGDVLARWMNDQIAEGRRRFESVPGVVTLMCAW